MSTLWALIRTHLFYWIVIAGAVFAVHSWLAEHDARILADVQVKDAQVTIDGLKQQISQRQTETLKQVQVIVKEVQAAKTPAEQLAEIPKLAEIPLNPVALPDAPSAVKVDLGPLVEQLGKCKEDAILLGSCQKELADRNQIELQQDKQVSALKKKPGFWKRLSGDAKKVGIGVAIGVGLILVERGIH